MQENVEYWREVSTNLDVALDLEEDARAAWLAELALKSAEVAAEVRRLLERRAQPEFERFLSGSAVNAIGAMPAVNLAGRSVGPYVLESELGRGGMGSVWLARRADGQYEGRVAIKFLATVWAGAEGQERFRREGQLLARLDHPNIARLLDAGVTDTQPYLVLEYIEGEHLDKYCDRRRMGVVARVELFLSVLEAVAHAHSHLVIHRDIKPANIMVTPQGAVKLLDFGVGRLLSEDAMHTRAGYGMFTPQYAAPEQIMGGELTTATDVHALGLVLYVLLTGVHPFAGATTSSAEIVRHVVETDAQLPSAAVTANSQGHEPSCVALRRGASPAGLGRLLRGDLDNIVAKALSKEPERRYASAGAFADDLRRFLTHEPISARADTVRYRAAKFVRRHRGGVTTALLLVMTLLGAVIVTLTQMREARAQRDEALFQSRRAESANEFMVALLQTDGGGSSPRSRSDRFNLGEELLEKQYAGDPRFAGRMLALLGRQFRGLTQTSAAVDAFDRAYKLGVQAQDPELMALARCLSADTRLNARSPGSAQEELAEGLALVPQLGKGTVLTQVVCLQAQAQLAKTERDYELAIEYLQHARRLMESSGNAHRVSYTSILTDIGGIYMERDQFAAAVQMAELASATHERFGRGGTTGRVTTLQNRMIALASMGEIREALVQRVEIGKRLQVLESPGKEPLYYPVNYAGLLVRIGKPEQALQELNGVLERARTSGNRFWLINALNSAAAAYLALHDPDQVSAVLAENTQLLTTLQPDNPELRLRVARAEAQLDLERGDVAEARKQVESTLAAMNYPVQKPSRAGYFVVLTAADVALVEGRNADAESLARGALGAAEAVARGPDTSADVGEALLRLGSAKLAMGQGAEAHSLFARAERCLTNGYGADHPATHKAHAQWAASTRA